MKMWNKYDDSLNIDVDSNVVCSSSLEGRDESAKLEENFRKGKWNGIDKNWNQAARQGRSAPTYEASVH